MSHAPDQPPDRDRLWRRNLRLYPYFYFFHDLQFWLAIWIIFATEDVGLSFSEVGFIAPAFYIITSFGQPPAGALADRFGRVRTIRISLVLFIAFLIWFAFSGSVWQAAVAWSLWGSSVVLITGADSAFLHDSLQALGRAREFERQAGRAFAVRSLAMVLATALGGAIAGQIGSQQTVLVGVIGLVIALLIAFRFREPPRAQSARSTQDAQRARPTQDMHEAGETSAPQLGYLQLMRQTLRLCRRTPSLRYALIFTALLLASMVPEFYVLQPFLREQGIEVGWLFSALQTPARIATVLAAFSAFWLASRFGVLRSLVAMPVLVIVAYASIAALNHLAALSLFLIIGFARGALMPLMEGYLNRRTPSHLRATMLSLNHMGWALFMLAFLPTMGRVLDTTPLPTVFAGIALIFGVLLAIAAFLWIRADRADARRLRTEAPTRDAVAKPQHSPQELPTAATRIRIS